MSLQSLWPLGLVLLYYFIPTCLPQHYDNENRIPQDGSTLFSEYALPVRHFREHKSPAQTYTHLERIVGGRQYLGNFGYSTVSRVEQNQENRGARRLRRRKRESGSDWLFGDVTHVTSVYFQDSKNQVPAGSGLNFLPPPHKIDPNYPTHPQTQASGSSAHYSLKNGNVPGQMQNQHQGSAYPGTNSLRQPQINAHLASYIPNTNGAQAYQNYNNNHARKIVALNSPTVDLGMNSGPVGNYNSQSHYPQKYSSNKHLHSNPHNSIIQHQKNPYYAKPQIGTGLQGNQNMPAGLDGSNNIWNTNIRGNKGYGPVLQNQAQKFNNKNGMPHLEPINPRPTRAPNYFGVDYMGGVESGRPLEDVQGDDWLMGPPLPPFQLQPYEPIINPIAPNVQPSSAPAASILKPNNNLNFGYFGEPSVPITTHFNGYEGLNPELASDTGSGWLLNPSVDKGPSYNQNVGSNSNWNENQISLVATNPVPVPPQQYSTQRPVSNTFDPKDPWSQNYNFGPKPNAYPINPIQGNDNDLSSGANWMLNPVNVIGNSGNDLHAQPQNHQFHQIQEEHEHDEHNSVDHKIHSAFENLNKYFTSRGSSSLQGLATANIFVMLKLILSVLVFHSFRI